MTGMGIDGIAQDLEDVALAAGVALNACLEDVAEFSLDRGALTRALEPRATSATDAMPLVSRVQKLLRNRGGQRESDLGHSQTEFDVVAHLLAAEALTRILPGSVVVGEEATVAAWDAAQTTRPGDYIWLLDAIDGSNLQDTVGFGFSSNVILYRVVGEGRADPVAGIVVTASSLMASWVGPRLVTVAYLSAGRQGRHAPDTRVLDAPIVAACDVRQGYVAVAGAEPDRRALVMPLLQSTSLTVLSAGGAPAAAGLLLGRLSALILPEASTRHDAVPLLALAAGQGMSFVAISDEREFADDEVRQLFSNVERPKVAGTDNPRYRPVPPMVIARRRDHAHHLASALRPAQPPTS